MAYADVAVARRGTQDEAVMTLPARIETLARERRGIDRSPIGAEGGVPATVGGIDVTILDLSETGFRAIAARELRIGSWVRLSLRGEGSVAPEAQVKWRRGNEHGFQFAFPLYADFVAAALSSAALGHARMLPPAPVPAIAMTWADYRARRCRFGDAVVALTPLMAEILSVMLIRRGESVTGAELAHAVWPDERIASNRMATLHVIIVRLRDRLPGLFVSPSRGSYMIPTPDA